MGKKFLAITPKNLEAICDYLLQQMEEEDGRGEFDEFSPLSSAIDKTIESFEEEGFTYLDYIKNA